MSRLPLPPPPRACARRRSRFHLTEGAPYATVRSALFHHTEALASELRAAKAELVELRATAKRQSGVIVEQDVMHELLSEETARAAGIVRR